MKIKEYKMISERDLEAFQKQVTESLEKEWDIYGSPFHHTGKYCQAMIKWSNPPNFVWCRAADPEKAQKTFTEPKEKEEKKDEDHSRGEELYNPTPGVGDKVSPPGKHI